MPVCPIPVITVRLACHVAPIPTRVTAPLGSPVDFVTLWLTAVWHVILPMTCVAWRTASKISSTSTENSEPISTERWLLLPPLFQWSAHTTTCDYLFLLCPQLMERDSNGNKFFLVAPVQYSTNPSSVAKLETPTFNSAGRASPMAARL